MQTELTTTPHPHDPHADDITWSQASDLIRYFADPFGTRRIGMHGTGYGIVCMFEGLDIMRDANDRQILYVTIESALKRAGAWPDVTMCPPPPRYVAVGTSVMRGTESIAVAQSHNRAKRIANALNWYKPGRRGC